MRTETLPTRPRGTGRATLTTAPWPWDADCGTLNAVSSLTCGSCVVSRARTPGHVVKVKFV